MPKKTRQEKIIAELRRKLAETKEEGDMKLEVRNERLDTRSEKLETRVGDSKNQIISLQSPTSHLTLPTSTSYIKKDLTKTLILTILVISLELVLYFKLR